jgi:hypothetical protein
VTAGGARRGRRDNGLDAADFAVAGDVDPRVGEHLLDVLQAVGIAAYLQPTADLNPILRATTLPARPTDRLYVDRAYLEAARAHLLEETGGRPPTAPPDPTREPDIEAEWAKIVAGFHTTVDPTAAPWPASEDLPTAPEPPPAPTEPVQHNRRRTDKPAEPTVLESFDAFGPELDEDDDEDEDRFVPPPPPPLPHISKYTVASALAVLLGFVLFLFPTLLPIDRNYVITLGFAAIVAGAVMLIWRLRSGDDDEDEDEDDNGAVV